MITKQRAISVTAVRDYRTGAYNDKNLDVEVLKIKINCLIDSSTHVTFCTCGKRYVFGSCCIEVDRENRIRSIEWLKEKKSPDGREISNLKRNYLNSGLNQRGTRFTTEEEKIERERQKAFNEMYL